LRTAEQTALVTQDPKPVIGSMKSRSAAVSDCLRALGEIYFFAFNNRIIWCIGPRARQPQRLIAMGRIVELPSIKPRSTSHRQGLRKLSPDLQQGKG
jgi:hypothetical protein